MYLSDTELICIAVAFGLNQKKPQKNKRRRWMKEWYKQRAQYSHEKLLNCLRMTEPDDYRNFLRMDATSYENLLKVRGITYLCFMGKYNLIDCIIIVLSL